MAETPHRCLVMVHGIGTQQRGGPLADVGEPLAAFLSGYVCAEGEPGITADLAPHAAGEADACVRFRDDLSVRELRLHEVWWSPRYAPPSFSPAALWTLTVFWSQLKAILIGLVHPDRGPNGDATTRSGTAQADAGVYRPAPRGALGRLYDAVIGFALLVVFALGAVPVFAVLLLAWLFDGLYGLLRLNALGATAAALREKVFTQHVSQVYLYLNSSLARASIRGAAEDVLRPLLTVQHHRQ